MFLFVVAFYTLSALLVGASVTAGILIFHVAVAPLIFKYSTTFRRHLVFANIVRWPVKVDYENPKANGIDGGRNFSIQYKSKVDNCDIKMGVWHILPKSAYEKLKGNFDGDVDKEELNQLMDSELMDSKYPVMLYCHGNSKTRVTPYRVKIYKFFQQMDYHTITFDYRGYADSTKVKPSEDGLVEDALIIYNWVHSRIEKAAFKTPIFVWGHSLGTGISAHLLGNLDKLSKDILERPKPLPLPNGLILEAPFSTLEDEMRYHSLALLVSWLPYFEFAFISPFAPSFRSDQHLSRVPDLPALLMHARDDFIVPYRIGVKLYHSMLESRAAGGAPIKFHSYDKEENLGHKWICHAKDLPTIVGEFVSKHR